MNKKLETNFGQSQIKKRKKEVLNLRFMSYKPSLNVRNVKTTCQRNDQDLTEIR